MNVQICYKKADTPSDKILIIKKNMTVKEARKYFDEHLKDIATMAYLRYFDVYHFRVHTYLKREEKG